MSRKIDWHDPNNNPLINRDMVRLSNNSGDVKHSGDIQIIGPGLTMVLHIASYVT